MQQQQQIASQSPSLPLQHLQHYNQQQQQQHHNNIVVDNDVTDVTLPQISANELNYVVLEWLSQQHLSPALISTLFDELNHRDQLPLRTDWNGQQHNHQSFNEIKQRYNHCTPGMLMGMLQTLLSLQQRHGHQQSLPFKVDTILGGGAHTILNPRLLDRGHNNDDTTKTSTTTTQHTNNDTHTTEGYIGITSIIPNQATMDITHSDKLPRLSITSAASMPSGTRMTMTHPPQQQRTLLSRRPTASQLQAYASSKLDTNTCPLATKILSRELNGSNKLTQLTPLLHEYSMTLGVFGHRAAIYCFAFDKTGDKFITGSDDHLVKIWSSNTSRLQYTLRAHIGDLTDISINFENSYLATASNDNTIRVWDLHTSVPISVLLGHETNQRNSITSVSFCPAPNRNLLLSSDTFGTCRLWDVDQGENMVLHESNAAPVYCAMFNRGGTLIVASCGTELLIWSLVTYPPQLVSTLQGHTLPIKLLQYNNQSDAIVSGSEDGHLIIWRNTYGNNWDKTSFYIRGIGLNSKRIKVKLRTVVWSLDDQYIITADHVVRVWNAKDGEPLFELAAHVSDVFILEPHPSNPRLLMSAGYDSQVILWDIQSGVMLNRYVIEGLNQIQISDGCFSPDGTRFGVTTTFGRWYILQVGGEGDRLSGRLDNIPGEQFFQTDYQPIVRDHSGNVLDQLTQTPPHLMPQPILVNYQGAPYNTQPSQPKLGEPYVDTPEYQKDIQRYNETVAMEMMIFNRQLQPVVVPDVLLSPSATAPESAEPPRPEAIAAAGDGANNVSVVSNNTNASIEDYDLPVPSDSSDEDYSESSSDDDWDGGEEDDATQAGDEADDNDDSDEDQDDDDSDAQMNDGEDDDDQIQTRSQTKKDIERRKRKILNMTTPLTRSRVTSQQLDEIIETLELPDELGSPGQDSDYDEQMNDPLYDLHHSNNNNMNNSNSGYNYNYNYNNNNQTQTTRPSRINGRRYKDSNVAPSYDLPMSDEDDYVGGEEDEKSGDDSNDDDYVNSEEEDDDDHVSNNDSNDEDEEYSMSNKPKPSPRKKRRSRFTLAKSASSPKVNKKPAVTRKANNKRTNNTEDTNNNTANSNVECPKWLRNTSNSPLEPSYAPQIGDNVVLFPQGYKLYIENYPESEHSLTDITTMELDSAQECVITSIMYIISSQLSSTPGLHKAILTLSTVREDRQDVQLKLAYHVSELPDYLVMASRVRRSIESLQWSIIGTQFRMYYPDQEQWYTGTIRDLTPSDMDFPDSLWERIVVLWDQDGEEGRVSPWEIDITGGEADGSPHDLDDSKPLITKLLSSRLKDIPEGIDDSAVKESIMSGLKGVTEQDLCDLYLDPVDLNDYPLYIQFVSHPMDYGTITERLENNYYRRVEAVLFDSELVMKNAFTYNMPNTSIARNSKKIHLQVVEVLRPYLEEAPASKEAGEESDDQEVALDDELLNLTAPTLITSTTTTTTTTTTTVTRRARNKALANANGSANEAKAISNGQGRGLTLRLRRRAQVEEEDEEEEDHSSDVHDEEILSDASNSNSTDDDDDDSIRTPNHKRKSRAISPIVRKRQRSSNQHLMTDSEVDDDQN
ncbi:hypothetical protein SAMD00019534_109350 [Acytostelium subglobosum LB1]|uniref:hypothetical protein n=1 Tax=Acytostelium subglobosum LB1 TaxID=1410327 RepID=UPI0006448B55|nr:hypothetical protein SAMD00019534_109350 [Acytostelium subglobosum LB1]GAM27759.1 hypothetical protein SAMD00019534_109350 [Acytostelium subglobosum LB1]|eukprot:XP_012749418.1 hypothetical protein SAMD00019534_109350 [Acytostelium subglobosum LB1]